MCKLSVMPTVLSLTLRNRHFSVGIGTRFLEALHHIELRPRLSEKEAENKQMIKT